MLRMDEVNKIRKRFFTHGENKSQIAKKFNCSWDTVNRIVNMERDDLSNRGKHPSRSKKVMTPEVVEAIEKYFEEEKEKRVRRKQRYTAGQIYRELKEKKIYKGSIRRMQEMVKLLREKHSQTKEPSFLPLDFPIGTALQIDHGEFDAEIEGGRVRGYLFVASVPGQVLRYCQAFPTKSREAWGEFHERALSFFGGVFPRVIYDNDSVLIKKVTKNGARQTDFSLSLEEHYGFESHFCNLAAGNEKGAVENGVGYCRRRFLPGCPSFEAWESANEFLKSCCLKDIETGSHYKTKEKLADLFAQVKNKLSPLPPRKTWCRWTDCRVNKCQLVTVDNHQYSVPEKFVGASVRAALTISLIEIFKDADLIASHRREYKGKDTLKLDHYLDQLRYKLAAFPYSKAVTQHQFHPKLLEMQNRLLQKHGKKEGLRQFIMVLLLQRKWGQKDLLKGVEKALYWGAIEPAAVETIIRQCQLSETQIDYEKVQKLIPVNSPHWDFDLRPYAELCEVVL